MKPPARHGRIGIAVLGSTGSVGRQTLQVIDDYPDRFEIMALAARSSSELFCSQVARYQPKIVATSVACSIPEVRAVEHVTGTDGLIAAATHADVDIVVIATSGHDAIEPTIRAIEHGKVIALANKETLVCAGELIMPLATRYGAEIRPVDSEHSAIWQSLGSRPTSEISRLMITASGGPFKDMPRDQLVQVTAREALAHPKWSMGDKISIDSATMMNKGLEVIEAHWLFGVAYEQIDVLVHPECVVHSLVEFVDGSQIGQFGVPDMRLPIQYALTYPERWLRPGAELDLVTIGALHFLSPDASRFPSLSIAREAAMAGETYPTVLSAADDEAVAAFLRGAIRFMDIPAVAQSALERHVPTGPLSLESIRAADHWARHIAKSIIEERQRMSPAPRR